MLQALKNSGSQRWQSLLSFSCRNRLLLTGTPIQNNMAELWSLLHFIMPTLFDNHAQFSEWFSKGVEGQSRGEDTLSDYQLKRLHAILKPFMLRRVKTEVAVEMVEKTEVNVRASPLPSRVHTAARIGGEMRDDTRDDTAVSSPLLTPRARFRACAALHPRSAGG